MLDREWLPGRCDLPNRVSDVPSQTRLVWRMSALPRVENVRRQEHLDRSRRPLRPRRRALAPHGAGAAADLPADPGRVGEAEKGTLGRLGKAPVRASAARSGAIGSFPDSPYRRDMNGPLRTFHVVCSVCGGDRWPAVSGPRPDPYTCARCEAL